MEGKEGETEHMRSGTEMALFICSLVLAVGHIIVAYRTSCRERRKLLVFKIDIEAVSLLSLFLKSQLIKNNIYERYYQYY